jgi:hypothetical protein
MTKLLKPTGFEATIDQKVAVVLEGLNAGALFQLSRDYSIELIHRNPSYEAMAADLAAGKCLKFYDGETNNEHVASLNLGMITLNWPKIPIENLIVVYDQNLDADGADSIIQHLLFGELRYS